MGCDPHWEEQCIETPEDLSEYTWFAGKSHAPGISSDAEFFACHKKERLSAVAALADDERRRMLAWMTGLGCTDTRYIPLRQTQENGITEKHGILRGCHGAVIPVVTLIPDGWDGKRVCLALSPDGKDCLACPEHQSLLADGIALVSGDLYLTGEVCGEQIDEHNPENNRYFTTFHNTTDANRVQDAARLIRYAAALGDSLTVTAVGSAACAAACALALCDGVSSAKLEERALTFADDTALYAGFFIPGIGLLGGARGCLALAKCPVSLF